MSGPIFHHARLDDPDQAVQHPALVEMIAKGWTVSTSFIGERNGSPELVLLLMPPKQNTDQRNSFLLTTAATAIGAAIGALAAFVAVNSL